jgi:hypothetical protein
MGERTLKKRKGDEGERDLSEGGERERGAGLGHISERDANPTETNVLF